MCKTAARLLGEYERLKKQFYVWAQGSSKINNRYYNKFGIIPELSDAFKEAWENDWNKFKSFRTDYTGEPIP